MVGGWTAEHDVLKTNFEGVKEGVNILHWDDILKTDFQHDYNSFFDTFQYLLEKHSPLLTPPYKKKTSTCRKLRYALKMRSRGFGKDV